MSPHLLSRAFALVITALLLSPAAAGERTKERFPESEFGGHITVHSAGKAEAPKVVLVHGLSENGASDWRSTIPALAEKHRVLAPDLPGFAESSRGNQLYSPDALARALHDVLGTHAPFVLVGHSLGGAVALSYAHQFPEDLEGLVLVSMAGVLHRTVYSEFLGRSGVEAVTGVRIGEDSWIKELTQGVLRQIENAGVDPIRLMHSPWLRQIMLGGNPLAIAAFALASHDFGEALRDTRTPTTLIWGDADNVAPLRTGHLASALMPDATLEVLDGVGHMPMLEAPERFNAALIQAVNGKRRSATGTLIRQHPDTERELFCEGEKGIRLQGDYRRITLDRCPDALIEDANIGELTVRRGSLRLRNSHVHEGIVALNAQLEITAGSVTGQPPLLLEASRLDAAGTYFLAHDGVVARNEGMSPLGLHFSVASRSEDDKRYRLLHKVVEVRDAW